MANDNSAGIGTFLAFTLGALLGAGLALILAPEEGEKTREKLRDLGEDYYARAKEKIDSEIKKRTKKNRKKA